MNILILSCNTGEGHNAAGHAVEDAALVRGHNVTFMDAMMLKGRRTSNIVGGAYVGIVKHMPILFGLIYKLGGLISNKYFKSPVYWANSYMAKHFKEYLEENNFDIIVTPHLYPAETLTYMKHHNMLNVKTVAIGTDYTCIPFWEETDCDYYVIPHRKLVDEYKKRGVSSHKLLPYGIPVRASFSHKLSRSEARKKCRLPEDTPVFLVMNGSMGFGKLVIFAEIFAKQCSNGEHIVIICGNNKKIHRILSRQFKDNSRVHIIGFTKHVSTYMDACDVIFTKPGGLTSTEALVKNIPIVHTAPIPGCETKNRDFFKSLGLSLTSKHILSQIKLGMSLVNDTALRNKLIENQMKESCGNAAEKIIELLEEIS